jgi:hypothetical protein
MTRREIAQALNARGISTHAETNDMRAWSLAKGSNATKKLAKADLTRGTTCDPCGSRLVTTGKS